MHSYLVNQLSKKVKSIKVGNSILDLSFPKIMGVLNVTPNSYYADSRVNIDNVLSVAEQMIADGVHILDVGGESTNPVELYPEQKVGPIARDEELDRVIPVIEKLSKEFDTFISIDTMKPVVMQEALNAGAHIVNDVNGLRADGAIEVVAKNKASVCIMHMQGMPSTMQVNPSYTDVVKEVKEFLFNKADECIKAGVDKDAICLDPGFCFGKTPLHNMELLRSLEEFTHSSYPVLVGISRKSMVGRILDKPSEDRLYGSISIHLLTMLSGASIIRTHDVAATADSIKIFNAYLGLN